ncbi:MAG TPA: cupin domain-containing protein [Pyrinomonadaceae bacterium]|jgi:uncharacterized protein YbjT (DUF2867 family)/quercetin dioxygenase-like cupin family protein|nr:cupin domain-containing protein [Pyrinomonadaceae bacterium]
MKDKASETESKTMKIVIIGGTGLIGSKVVNILRQRGHQVVAASPSSGVNTLTGEGLAEALAGAQVVVDVANSPSFEDKPALEFFETSGRNLLAAEKTAGVRHHMALSVVGTDRLLGSGPGSLSGYFRAKMAQENLIKASGIPFTIVHATQFFEFVKNIAQSATDGSTIRLSPVLMQPMVSDDVAVAVADVALGEPMNAMVEVAGPDKIRQDELVRQFLTATGDPRNVVTDANAGYYGIKVNDQSLVPGDNPRLGTTRFEEWLSRTTPQKKAIEPQATPPSSLPGKVGKVVTLLLCGIVFAALSNVAATTEPKEAKLTELMSKDLTDLPGKEGLMLVIEYPPGSSDPIHRHNAHGFIYVLEGSIVMQVRGGKEVTLTPGQTFYEGPEDVHVVGRNASQTKPAKFVVFFVKDKGAPVLVPTN